MAVLLNDIGHGVNTWPPSKGTNASGGVPGIAEHTFNAAIGAEVKRLLSGKLATFEAQPPGGRDVSLNARVSLYNSRHAADRTAIGMSHHGNAGKKDVRGFGVFYWHSSAQGKKLAERVLSAYKKEFPNLPIWGTGLFASRVGDWTNFAMVRDPKAPFVLIEWEFFTNDEARRLMHTTDYRNRCAKVAASVAAEWYGIKVSGIKPNTPAPLPVNRDYLQEDDHSPKVGVVQANLNRVGAKPPLDVDNIYGGKTKAAVISFQLANDLDPDGVWGKKSEAMMSAILKELDKPVVVPEPPAPAPEAKSATKPKEEEEMAEKVVVAHGHADSGIANLLAEYLGCSMIFRKHAEGKQVAKEVYVVGGGQGKIKADKVVDLSGKTRWQTAKNVTAQFK